MNEQEEQKRVEAIVGKFWTKAEVQKLLGAKSEVSLDRWIDNGFFPEPRRLSKRRVFWLSRDIIAWVEDHGKVIESSPAGGVVFGDLVEEEDGKFKLVQK